MAIVSPADRFTCRRRPGQIAWLISKSFSGLLSLFRTRTCSAAIAKAIPARLGPIAIPAKRALSTGPAGSLLSREFSGGRQKLAARPSAVAASPAGVNGPFHRLRAKPASAPRWDPYKARLDAGSPRVPKSALA